MPTEPFPHEAPTAEDRASLFFVRASVNTDTTGSAPPFHWPAGEAAGGPLAFARPGVQVDDFELVRELGTGAFGKVFLARQITLDRSVALKITQHQGHEARTLAHLEHDHIVRVFSEVVVRERGLLLLCMQYVPGTTLDRVIGALPSRDPTTWNGRTILEVIDQLSTEPAAFDPAALRDRELLGACDLVEAVCWLGTCLALALAHAHGHKILHRDIKPANILLNRYGRPLLADFNVAHDPRGATAARPEAFGGTLPYMAPEHLDAFNPSTPAGQEAVDERSDIYSLGLVLFELFIGQRPFQRRPHGKEAAAESARAMVAERRGGLPPAGAAEPALCRVIRRCLAPDPDQRYHSAAELAAALEGARELHRLDKRLPAPGPCTRRALQRPLTWLALFGLFPHVVASLINIAYNDLRISLTGEQRATFFRVTLVYNAITYSLGIYVLCRLLSRLYQAWQLQARGELGDTQARLVRRRVMRLPLWVMFLSAAGWLPGGVLFPLAIHKLSGPIAPDVFWHFLVSFVISGLIALTYCVLAVQYVALRVLYPRFWGDGQGLLRDEAAADLSSVSRRLIVLQLLAGAIPLAAAVLTVDIGPEQAFHEFRVLVTALITLGIAGFAMAMSASNFLVKVVQAISPVRSIIQPSGKSHADKALARSDQQRPRPIDKLSRRPDTLQFPLGPVESRGAADEADRS